MQRAIRVGSFLGHRVIADLVARNLRRVAARLALGLAAGIASSFVARGVASEIRVAPHPTPPFDPLSARPWVHEGQKKGSVVLAPRPLRGTLFDTHSSWRLAIDDAEPTPERFSALLQDPVMRTSHPVAPAILGLVRALTATYPGARFEVVSGYRSPKLNEALRKKGHHVASHSQHSLGQAMDFRVVAQDLRDGGDASERTDALDPQTLASEVRALGWQGGVGIYRGPTDRFVHVDVGPRRSWNGS